MNTIEFDRRLNEWFDAAEPRQIPAGMLPAVFSQVPHVGQQRGPLHRFTAAIEQAWVPQSRFVQGMALVALTALLIAALVFTAFAAGILPLRRGSATGPGLIAVQDGHVLDGKYQIRFIDPDSGEDVFVTPSTTIACAAHFSPDGSHYAFLWHLENGAVDIAVAPVGEDFQPTVLKRKDAQNQFHPSWAPDGSALVVGIEVPFAEDAAFSGIAYYELWILPSDGSAGTRLTDVQASVAADWSASGEWIAFASSTTGALYIIRPDGTDLRMLRDGGVGLVGWSPVKDELAYAGNGQIHVIDLDGTELATLGGDGGGVAWSPDGKKIARAVGPLIRVFDIASGSVNEIAMPPGAVGRLTWSPNSNELVVDVSTGENDADPEAAFGRGPNQLWDVYLDGRPPRLIVDGIQTWCMSGGFALDWQRVTE